MMQSVIVRSALTYFIEAAKGGGVKEEEQQQACKQFRDGPTTCKPGGKCTEKHCLIVQTGQKASKM